MTGSGAGGAGDAPDPRAYELAACGLLTTAPDGEIVRVNATLATWLGQPADALVGRRFQDLLTVGSKLFHQTHWMPLLQMQGSVAEVQLEMVCHNGAVLPVLVNARLRDGVPEARALRGPLDVAVFVASDRRKYERELLLARRRAEELLEREREAQEALARTAAERQRAEEEVRQREREFRTLAENSPDVIMRFDRDRRCTYVSPAASRFTARPLEHYVGRGVEALGVGGDARATWAIALERALEGGESTFAFGYDARDGTRRELQTAVVPERDGRGDVVGVLCITRDVTVLRQQERDAQQRAVLAEQLIGIVSHDLRNPLNAIVLGARLLATAPLGPHARTVDRITSAAGRANRLIADLLDFTQARLGGGLRVERIDADVHQVVGDAVEEVRLAWAGRALIHRRVGDGLAQLDPDRLAQVVTNLTGNALTYGAPDDPVTVTTLVGASNVEVHVHNTGAPIPPELQAHIFEPMRRGEGDVRKGHRSVGLGLYIVREIAGAHGGTITVRSTADEGTTFVVTLPRGGAAAAPA